MRNTVFAILALMVVGCGSSSDKEEAPEQKLIYGITLEQYHAFVGECYNSCAEEVFPTCKEEKKCLIEADLKCQDTCQRFVLTELQQNWAAMGNGAGE